MKKILLSLFAISGLFLITGCSLTETTNDTNLELKEQISILQQQMSGINSEIKELKEKNNELIEENKTIKISLSDQSSGTSILLAQNKELKKDVEKYKQILMQKRLKDKESIDTNKDNQNGISKNITSQKTLTYLISKEQENKYCDGENMDSEGYKKTITTQIITDIPIDNMTRSELAKATIIAATKGQCKDVLKVNNIRVEGDIAYISPIDGWAGSSIAMCSCIPQIKVNLLNLPNINNVIFE